MKESGNGVLRGENLYSTKREREREREKGFAFYIFNLFYGDKFVSFCFRVLFFFVFVYGG